METIGNSQPGYVRKNSIKDVKLNVDTFIHVFCFLSVLFIGADLFGVNVGVNLRFDQILLLVFTLLLAVKGEFKLTYNFWIIAFAICSLISTVFAFNVRRGILFYFSIIYNIIFLFYAFSSYVKTYGIKKFIKIFRTTCYVQFAIFICQYILKIFLNYELPLLPTYGYYLGIPRFRLWFYEPSYMATYMIFWFALSFYLYLVGNNRSYLKDIILCLLLLVLCTATTGFLGIALVVVSVYFIWLFKRITLKKLLFPIIVLILFLVVYLAFKDIFDVFIGRLFNGSLDDASGGRITGWQETIDVFKLNPLFGVGPGNYGLYLDFGVGHVPSNVTLELCATLGIFSTIAFYGLTVKLIIDAIKINKRLKNQESQILVACALGLLIFTITLQANQGYLRLYHWMFFGLLSGGIYSLKFNSRSVNMNTLVQGK